MVLMTSCGPEKFSRANFPGFSVECSSCSWNGDSRLNSYLVDQKIAQTAKCVGITALLNDKNHSLGYTFSKFIFS